MANTEIDVNGDYHRLVGRLRAEGLMDRRRAAFAVKSSLVLMAAACSWGALLVVGDRWVALVVAVALGVVSTQIVFFGHAAGHHQLFARPGANRAAGLVVGDLLTGLSFGWWEPKHRAHHAHPNQIDRDPDIAPGAVAFATSVASRRHGVGRTALRWQAWTFFPLLTLEGAVLRVSGVRSVLGRRRERRARVEIILIAAHLLAYATVIFWELSPLKAVVFIAVQQATFGVYLGACFAPNHTGMPTLAVDAQAGFAERQIVTARNLKGGPLATFLLGGLNYQIEHHLFPKMPMANLRRAQPLVREYCQAHGLPYQQEGLIDSYRAVLIHLSRIGKGHNVPTLRRVRPLRSRSRLIA